MPDNFGDSYKKYLSSSVWKKKRLEFIENNYNTDPERVCYDEGCYMCDACGWNWLKGKIEVHHKHYLKFFGKETRKDVLVVCKSCHPTMDKIRAQQGWNRSQAALESATYDSGFGTWITKRYGEDAIGHYTESEVEHERFQAFLERNEGRDW